MSAALQAIERRYPGLTCGHVYCNPHHHSGTTSLNFAVEGSRSCLIQHGLITPEMTEGLPPFSKCRHFIEDGRMIHILREESEFYVEITCSGSAAQALIVALGFTGHESVKAEEFDDAAPLRSPPQLRLVVDNTSRR